MYPGSLNYIKLSISKVVPNDLLSASYLTCHFLSVSLSGHSSLKHANFQSKPRRDRLEGDRPEDGTIDQSREYPEAFTGDQILTRAYGRRLANTGPTTWNAANRDSLYALLFSLNPSE